MPQWMSGQWDLQPSRYIMDSKQNVLSFANRYEMIHGDALLCLHVTDSSCFPIICSISGAFQPPWMLTIQLRIPTPEADSTLSSAITAWPSKPAHGPYLPGFLQDR